MTDIVFTQNDLNITFTVGTNPISFVVSGTGPPGPTGAAGSGFTYEQESPPGSPSDGDTWYKPSNGAAYTYVLSDTAWVQFVTTKTIDSSIIDYDNTTSGLTATKVQSAIDEVEGRVDTLETGKPDNFDELDDVPAYTGNAGLVPRVKSTEDGIEFTTGAQLDGPSTSTDHAWPRYNGTDGDLLQDGDWTEDDSGNVTAGGSLTMGDSELITPKFKDYSKTRTTPSSSSGTLVLDYNNGNAFEVTLTESVSTLTINNWPTSGDLGEITLISKQDGTGGWSYTWPGSFKWPGGTPPTQSTTANQVDIYSLITTDAGTTVYARQLGANMS